jgi:hypothetical protein
MKNYILNIVDLSKFYVRKKVLEARLRTWYCVGDELELTLINVRIAQSNYIECTLARSLGALYVF